MYSVAFPEPASPDLLETLQEIQGLACRERSITDVSGDRITLHFTTVRDAMSFLDLFFYLHEEMSQDEAAEDLTAHERCGGRPVDVAREDARDK